MPKPARFQGEYVNHTRPDWRWILAMVGTELTSWFMWMGEIELSDGTRVHAYKHRDSRRYLHIGVDGRCFFYDWDGKTLTDRPCDYVELSRPRAIDSVFRAWRHMLDPRESEEIRGLIDAAWDVASADGVFEIDPRELELQAEYEAEERNARDEEFRGDVSEDAADEPAADGDGLEVVVTESSEGEPDPVAAEDLGDEAKAA